MPNNHSPLQCLLALCIVVISMLSGCRSSREITTSGEAVTLKTERDFYAAFQEQSFRYQTFSARVQFEITLPSGKEASSRAQVKIRRNERLQISFRPLLGIEVFGVELTPDSMKVVDRLHKQFLIESYDKIQGSTDIDFNFYNLQALLTNRLFLPGEAGLPANLFDRFRWEQTRTGYLLRTEDRTGIRYAFTADPNEKLSATEIRDESSNFTLNCHYDNFRPVDRQLFPMNINIRLHTGTNSQSALSLSFSGIEVDAPFEMNFPIPPGYRQASLQEVLHAIEQL